MKAVKLRNAVGALLLPPSLYARLRTIEEDLASERQENLLSRGQVSQQIGRLDALETQVEVLQANLTTEKVRFHKQIMELQREVSEVRLGLLDHRSRAALIARKLAVEAAITRRPRHAVQTYNVEEQRSKLSTMFPHVFPAWAELFDNARMEYEARPISSLSVEGNPGSTAFAKFISLYAHGSVLDVGCGPQALPSYLADLNADRVVGVDPLPGSDVRNFEFVQSLGEFLPWPDGEFDAVISATSLDHAISLEMTLSEIRRVIRPGGYFLAWVGFVPGAPPYDPDDPESKPIDNFHLFHFDRPWFLDLLLKHFRLVEEFQLDKQSHFFAFTT